MMCKCGGGTRVVDSRHPKPNVVKRIRLCEACGTRFPTYESRESPSVMRKSAEDLSAAWRARRDTNPEWYRANRKRSNLRRKAREAAQITGQPVETIYEQWGVA